MSGAELGRLGLPLGAGSGSGSAGGSRPRRLPAWLASAREPAEVAVAVGLLLAYQLGPAPLALAAALAYLLLAWRWPAAALAAVLLALPYYLVTRPVLGGWAFSAAEVGSVLTAAAGGLRLALTAVRRVAARDATAGRDRSAPSLDLFDLAALGFVALGLLSIAISLVPRESARAFRTVILEPVALYFVASRLGGGSASARRLALALVAAGVGVALLGLYQYAANVNIITAEESLRRIRGLYGSPNHLGLFLGRVAPLALVLWLLGRSLGRPARWLGGLALLPLGAALALTFSLGAWLGVAAAFLYVVVALRDRRLLLTALAGLAALAALAAPLLARLERFRSHLDLGEGTTALRLQVWQSALAMLRDHPLLGIGLDNFLYYYRELGYMLPAAWREPSLSHPHNLLLDFWLSLGLPGLLLALALLYRVFGLGLALAAPTGRRGPDEGPDPASPVAAWRRALALGVTAGMVDFVAHGLLDNSYFLPDLAVLLWLSCAILRLLCAEAGADEQARRRPAPAQPGRPGGRAVEGEAAA